eukprot:CAMPEP_0182520006 /NCGR_PEP_ID=MMETSP1321-20130603/45395_1 /TAXON_ID=91990 /ORGANISM="Bolidomonas sp., Strain RCC1657" /LENGTH=314 /DNA_ID=CAMNT_0024728007 /DNA_START=430 /DNA_END=1371 /DNA_ORIENTATION=-
MSNSAIRSLIRTQRWKDAMDKINEAPNECKLKGTQQMNYVLHEAVTHSAPLEVVQLLVKICPKACSSKDRDKKKPIDIAMGMKLPSGVQRNPNVVGFLLKHNPEVALAKIDKVMKSNAKRRKSRRSLDSLTALENKSLSPLPDLPSPSKLPEDLMPEIDSLTKLSSPTLPSLGPLSPRSQAVLDAEEDEDGLTSTVARKPKREMKRRASFGSRVLKALFGESRDLEAEAQAEAKAKIMAQVSEGVAKEAPRRLSFKGTSSAAGVSAVRGISLKDGAMDFGVDTPVEVLAALASLHSDEDGGKQGGGEEIGEDDP